MTKPIVLFLLVAIVLGTVSLKLTELKRKADPAEWGKAILNTYVQAIEAYRDRYDHYPHALGGNWPDGGKRVRLNHPAIKDAFIKAVGGPEYHPSLKAGQSKKPIALMEFSPDYFDQAGNFVTPQGSRDIYLVVDHNRDGIIPFSELPEWFTQSPSADGLPAEVIVYVDDGQPGKGKHEYGSWEHNRANPLNPILQ